MTATKYIVTLCCLLVGCDPQKTDHRTSPQSDAPPTAVETGIPKDVADAVAVLLSSREDADPAVVSRAYSRLEEFEKPDGGLNVTTYDSQTGEYGKIVTMRFPKLGIHVCYRNGKFNGASRIKAE